MGGSSKSKSSSATNYSNEDRRVVADGGSLGLSAENLLGTGNLQVQGNKNKLGFTDSSTAAGNGLLQGDRNAYTDNRVSTINTLDGGAIRASADVVQTALATVSKGDATNGEGFTRLLDLAGRLFEGAGQVVSEQQAASQAAFSQAAELRSGTVDNKTIMVVAVAGAAALAWGMHK